MTQTTGTASVEMYRGWAEIVLKLWKRKIQDMNVWNTGELYDSLAMHVISQANGDVARIEFFFNYYGRFVDMGMGREFFRGNAGDIGLKPKRKRKPWYSKVFYGNMNDLVRLVAEKYGQEAAGRIAGVLRSSGVSRDLKTNT